MSAPSDLSKLRSFLVRLYQKDRKAEKLVEQVAGKAITPGEAIEGLKPEERDIVIECFFHVLADKEKSEHALDLIELLKGKKMPLDAVADEVFDEIKNCTCQS